MTMISVAPASAEKSVQKTITFDGGAGSGAIGTVTVFTLSGRVVLTSIFCTCTTGLAGATATVALGTATTTGGLIAATTATLIVATRLWIDTGPDNSVFGVHSGATAFAGDIVVTENIIITVATANVTGGVLVFNATYEPLTDGGNIT